MSHVPFDLLDSRMTFTVQLFFPGMQKILRSGTGFLQTVRCRVGFLFVLLSPFFQSCTGAASFQEGLLSAFSEEAFLLPTDLLFEKDLETGSYRLPATTASARPLRQNALRYPLVFDGFSPRSHLYVPVPCGLREDLIPEQDSHALFLYDMSYRHRVPVTVRYRNRQNCGLVVRPRRPLAMDRTYALVVLQSYVWQDRLQQPYKLERLFERLRSTIRDIDDLDPMAEPFGLRARETRLALDLLRREGISSRRILRLGIFIVRSKGGLYGPYFAMLRRYQLTEKARIESVKQLDRGLYRITVSLRRPCSGGPCQLEPVFGPGILVPSEGRQGSMVERDVLVRLPEAGARRFMWMETLEDTEEKNRKLMSMPIFSRLSDEGSVALAVLLQPRSADVNERIANLLEKNSISRLIRSFRIEELNHCVKQERCMPSAQVLSGPLMQLCLTKGDCTASAALDTEVGYAILPVDDELHRPVFDDGRLPDRDRIVADYARDLREDLFSIDLCQKYMKANAIPAMKKKVHVMRNIFNRNQYRALVRFIQQAGRGQR